MTQRYEYEIYQSNTDFIEGGVYAQVLTVGIYVGWSDNLSGVSVGVLHQVSAGVAAYSSGGFVVGANGFDWAGNSGVGFATPTGISTVFTGGAFYNIPDNTITATAGIGVNDFLEFGVYGQTDIPETSQIQSYEWKGGSSGSFLIIDTGPEEIEKYLGELVHVQPIIDPDDKLGIVIGSPSSEGPFVFTGGYSGGVPPQVQETSGIAVPAAWVHPVHGLAPVAPTAPVVQPYQQPPTMVSPPPFLSFHIAPTPTSIPAYMQGMLNPQLGYPVYEAVQQTAPYVYISPLPRCHHRTLSRARLLRSVRMVL